MNNLELMEEYRKLFAEREDYSPFQFMGIRLPEGTKGLYVLVNVETGERVGEKVFEDHGSFKDEVAPVCAADKWGYIKTDGEYLISPAYRLIEKLPKRVVKLTDWDGRVDLYSFEKEEYLCRNVESVELFGDRDDMYIVRDGNYGVLMPDGKWLLDPYEEECKRIRVLSEELVCLSFVENLEEVQNIFSIGNILVSGSGFDFSFLEAFGVFSCYSQEKNQTEYFRLVGNEIESLFVEEGAQRLKMETPDVIFGTIQKWNGSSVCLSNAMFSVSKKTWLFRGMHEIEYHKKDGFEYFVIWNGCKKGVTDVSGNILIDIEASQLKYCLGYFLVAVDGKWGVYSLAEKRLILPLAETLHDVSNEEFLVYIFGKKKKGKIRSKMVYRYWVNGRFVTDYEYSEAWGYKKYGNVWFACVKRVDGKSGWIDTEGEFFETLPGEFDLK
ncbi:MAG: hypothetical protein J6M02_04775 [Clostridia bacterium]|nr:hypothetical protein [Clostridia bacterium]